MCNRAVFATGAPVLDRAGGRPPGRVTSGYR